MRWIILLGLLTMLTGCSFLQRNQTNMEQLNIEKKINYKYAKENYPITINNLKTGRSFENQKFDKPPKRIIGVWQNSIETPIALGVGDRIIAGMGVYNSKYIKKEYREEYEKIPITSMENLDQESVIMMQPDMIIGWYSTFTSKYLRSTDFWHRRGVGTYIAVSSAWLPNGQIIENEYNDILNLGKIFDKQKEAEVIVNAMKEQIFDVLERTKNIEKKPRALVLGGMGRQLGVYGANSLAGDLVKKLNGELLAENERTISAEQVVIDNPDVIFFLVEESRYQDMDRLVGQIYERPAFKNLKCAREKRIIPLPLNSIYTPGVRTIDGIKIIACGLYPELYKEKQ